MDTQRLIAFMVFSLSALLLWDAWIKHTAPKTSPAAITQQGALAPAPDGAIPAPSKVLESKPGAAALGQVPGTKTSSDEVGSPIVIRTDLLEVELSTLGGDIRRVTLLKHFSAKDRTKPLTLMAPVEGHYYVTQSGLLEGLPNHRSVFKSEATSYSLDAGAKNLEVRLTTTTAQGAEVVKTFGFKAGSYVIDVGFQIKNTGAKPISPQGYFLFVRDSNPPEGEASQSNPFTGVATYTGPALYTTEKHFQKVDFSEIEKGKQSYVKTAKDGWMAMIQHYFVAVWMPTQGRAREYFTDKAGEKLYRAGVKVQADPIAPGTVGSLTVPLFVGPQDQEQLRSLKALAPELDLVVDYGFLTVLAVPLFWLLNFIHGFVGNWGWAIIIMTILIKAVFFPLNQKAGKSMAHMKAVAPRIQQIQQRYADDKVKMNQAMMELYRTEKINPLGGCLPILVQIPVFIALYWVLLAAVELRHSPWIGWIQDLSVPDPYYILPLIMAVSMYVQTKLNPPPPDPVQAKIMLFMPLVFSIFFFFFPAGLVLYWTVQNLIGIAQQWWINKLVEGEVKAKPAGKR